MTPSVMGIVSSKTEALVKLRMLKLSSHFMGQGRRRPLSSYSTRIFRANIDELEHSRCRASDIGTLHRTSNMESHSRKPQRSGPPSSNIAMESYFSRTTEEAQWQPVLS